MSTNLFDHTPVATNSNISPVENLANELTLAFSKVESIINSDNNILPSFSKIIGNYLLASVNHHGVEEEKEETFILLKDNNGDDIGHNKDFVLESEVIENGLISVSYLDKTDINNPVNKNLTIKAPDQKFNGDEQCKVLGKVVSISSTINSDAIKIKYKGKKKDFGDLKLKPNVLMNEQNQYLLSLQYDSTNSSSNSHIYFIEYGDSSYDLSVEVLKYFGTPNLEEDKTYLLIKDANNYKVLEYLDISVQDNKLIFVLDEQLDDDYNAIVFIVNESISDFIESFYKEYMNHSHRSNSFSTNHKFNTII